MTDIAICSTFFILIATSAFAATGYARTPSGTPIDAGTVTFHLDDMDVSTFTSWGPPYDTTGGWWVIRTFNVGATESVDTNTVADTETSSDFTATFPIGHWANVYWEHCTDEAATDCVGSPPVEGDGTDTETFETVEPAPPPPEEGDLHKTVHDILIAASPIICLTAFFIGSRTKRK